MASILFFIAAGGTVVCYVWTHPNAMFEQKEKEDDEDENVSFPVLDHV